MIIQTPDPVLTTPARKVLKIDTKILAVVSEMKKTLLSARSPKGVGLAAPQIGIPLRVFITRPHEKADIDVFINPEVIWQSPHLAEIARPEGGMKSLKKDKKLEGCLSVHNVWGYLKRPSRVKLKYMDMNGVAQEKEFTGFMATIVQHETDHLNGILFTRRVMEQHDKLYSIEEDGEGGEKLVEIEI